MFLETIIVRLPNAETPVIAVPSTHMLRKRHAYIREGKLICASTIIHDMVQVTARIFRDKEAFAEWHADPIVQAQNLLYLDHYARNGIEVVRTSEEI